MSEKQPIIDDSNHISGIIATPCIVTFTGVPENPLLPSDLKLLCSIIVEASPAQITSLAHPAISKYNSTGGRVGPKR